MRTEDDIRDVAIRITDKLVDMGIIPDCIDTDNEIEFEVQDLIVEEIHIGFAKGIKPNIELVTKQTNKQ